MFFFYDILKKKSIQNDLRFNLFLWGLLSNAREKSMNQLRSYKSYKQ